MKTILFVIVTISIFFCAGLYAMNTKKTLILLWPGSKAYLARQINMKLNDDLALNVAKSVKAKLYFSQKPLLIVGDFYLFSEPDKYKTRLQGLYVNGMTGYAEYRCSAVLIDYGKKNIMPSAYKRIIKAEDLKTIQENQTANGKSLCDD